MNARTARQALAALVAALVGVAALVTMAGVLLMSHQQDTSTSAWDVDTASDVPASCGYVDANAYTADEVAALIAQGWYGDPTDHAERLYAPSC